MCIIVSLSVKAVHVELLSDLTSEALLATLHCFIARRKILTPIWSDHGTNFVSTKRTIPILEQDETQHIISNYSTSSNIE